MKFIEATDADKDRIYGWLKDYNHENNGDFMRSLEEEGTEKPLFLTTKNDRGEIIGGLEGLLIHQWLRIEIMAIDPRHRNQGIGRDLVDRAETLAKGQGCLTSFVDTMSYQAPGFYEALGYQVVGRIPNWDSHGHDKIYLTKKL